MSPMLRVLLLVVVGLALASPARADRITAGSLTYPGGGAPLDITLTSLEFRFDGRASPFSGIFMPWAQCLVPECIAGVMVDLRAHFSGLDLRGTAAVGTQTIPNVGSAANNAFLVATWSGALQIPPAFHSGVLTAPFAFTGLFGFEESPGVFRQLDLFGWGTATAAFAQQPAFPGAVVVQSITYEFEADVSPTPEPASMILLGTGLGGLFAARRLRRAGAQRSDGPHP